MNKRAGKEGGKERQKSQRCWAGRLVGRPPPPAKATRAPTLLPSIPACAHPPCPPHRPQPSGVQGSTRKPNSGSFKTQGCGKSSKQLPQGELRPPNADIICGATDPGERLGSGGCRWRTQAAAQANTGLRKHSSSPSSPLRSSRCRCRGMPGPLEWGGHTVGAPGGHAVLAPVSSSHPVIPLPTPAFPG